mgnify:CR=1 FL=1
MGNTLVKDVLEIIDASTPFIIMIGDRKVSQGVDGSYGIREEHWKTVDCISDIIERYGNMKVCQISARVSPPDIENVPYIRIDAK